ncbi:outer membrane protein assembly factor BamD [Pararhodonellum marinum]|uniref:outer membrane protein assembly factor BamD n=1 Tax=Pararhodonellum marinum TaxID=2755358 RepID=UPI00374464B5
MTKLKNSILFLLIAMLGFSCGQFYKLEKSTNWEELYNAANDYYQKGEYNKAIILFDKVLPVIRGSEKSELAEFNYAYSHFHTKRYIEAANYFSNFHSTYNRSPLAEEALFMNAYSLYLDAPDYNLDQTSSKDAVNAIQVFINKFPESDSYERAMTMIDDLQKRFEEKAYQEAQMYLKLTQGLFPGDFYRACIVNFQNFAKRYPDSKYNEELAYQLVEVSSAYGERSVFTKKEERLKESLKFASEFNRKYADSKYVKRVSNISNKTQTELESHIRLKKDYEERTAAAKAEMDAEQRNLEASQALKEAETNSGN